MTGMCAMCAMCAARRGKGASVSIRKIPPAPRSLPLVFSLRVGPEGSGGSFIWRNSAPVKGPHVRPSGAAIWHRRTRPAMAAGDYFPAPAKSR
jgi:hypothetical protein